MHIVYEENITRNVWFTADHHFGHANIIKYCDRPWKTVGEMDEALIDNWNSVVGPNDLVYHLGDFTLLGYDEFWKYISRLNGNIRIVPGGHDHRWLEVWKLGTHTVGASKSGYDVTVTEPLLTLEFPKVSGGYPDVVVLCHYAMRVWDRSHHGSYHLYGHSHGYLARFGLSVDVGVDCWDYKPISLAKVRKVMEEEKRNA